MQWLEASKNFGVGSTFILGIFTAVLWNSLNKEREYIRKRDSETLAVVQNLSSMLDKHQFTESTNTDKILGEGREHQYKLLQNMEAILKAMESHARTSQELISLIGKVEAALVRMENGRHK